MKRKLVTAILLLNLYSPSVRSALSISHTNSTILLEWNGEDQVDYRMVHSTNLVDWVNDGPSQTGDGSDLQLTATEVLGSAPPEKSYFKLEKPYPDNAEAQDQDILTPSYYHADTNAPFRRELNRFVYYAQKSPFHHPLENADGQIPNFYVSGNGYFGAGKGPTGTAQHHPYLVHQL
ncbi:MAG: hypothetical protein V3V05_00165 [Pontiella sp.]